MATINIDNIDENVFTQNERISKYLQGQMTKEEELAFLEDVKKDHDFKARAIAAARLAKGISDVGKEQDKDVVNAFKIANKESVMEIAKKVAEEEKSTARILAFKKGFKVMSVAASILFIVFVGFQYKEYNHVTSLGNDYAVLLDEPIFKGNKSPVVDEVLTLNKNVVEKKDLITGENIKPGNKIIGIASSGVHSNGFSLVRKVFDITKESLDTYYPELGTTLGEALLAPTIIYVKALKEVKNSGVVVKGCSHITGGGFYENIPRMLPDGVSAVINKDSYEVPAIFKKLAKDGDIAEDMMYNTYNMGIGMMIVVDECDVDKAMEAIKNSGQTPYVIGEIIEGDKSVVIR